MCCCLARSPSTRPGKARASGGLLINESLSEARRLGWERVLLVGDAPYYSPLRLSKSWTAW